MSSTVAQLALAPDVNRCFTVLQVSHFIASRFTPMKLRRWAARETFPVSRRRTYVKPRTRRVVTVLLNCALMLALAYAGWLVYGTWRGLQRGRQVRNCADLQTITDVIRAFHDKTGRYPRSIREAVDASSLNETNKVFFRRQVDAWGGTFRYRLTKGGFTLVSYGRDQEPDGRELLSATTERVTCQNLGTDVFANETGVVRCCGK